MVVGFSNNGCMSKLLSLIMFYNLGRYAACLVRIASNRHSSGSSFLPSLLLRGLLFSFSSPLYHLSALFPFLLK